MRWIRKISIADYVTLANALLGFIAITYIIDRRFTIAYFLLFLCILIDGVDGRIARKLKSKHRFGHYIDSLADAISFCFAPSILMYTSFYDPSKGSSLSNIDNAVAVAVPTLFLCFGIMRLARFSASGYRKRHFVGMPTPAAAFLVINLCILFGVGGLLGANEYLVILLALGTSFLMISDLPYPKIGGALFLPTGVTVLATLVSTVLLIMGELPFVSVIMTIFGLAFIFFYTVGGPLYVKSAEAEYAEPKHA